MSATNALTNDIAVSSRVRLARNISGCSFPVKAGAECHGGILKPVYTELSKLGTFRLYNMGKHNTAEILALKEKHLISDDLIANKQSGAAIISEDETVSVMINEEDHVREQCVLPGFSLTAGFNTLDKIDDILSKKLSFAFDGNLGYLTACPTNLGTGMRASVMLFLPALTFNESISAIVSALSKMGIAVRGVYGEGSKAEGYMYQVSNQVSLGVSEADIIKNVEATVLKICEAEQTARKNMLESDPIEVKDRVLRAYGILTHCVKLSSDEFMRLISQIKLGAAMGIIRVNDKRVLDELVVKVQPANISLAAGRTLTAPERDMYRADCTAKILDELVDKKSLKG